jgi:hypothetical protein
MQIHKLTLDHLHNEEWFNLFGDFNELVPKYGANTLGIQPLVDLIEPLYYKADKVLMLTRKSSYTQKMKVADSERNKIFRGLYKVIEASLAMPDATKKDAAERLIIVATEYRKSALQGSYAEESSALFNFLQDMEGKYAADVTALQLSTWVDGLKAVEQKFLEHREQRTREEIDKPKDKMKPIRKQVDAFYYAITEILYAKLLADGLGGDVSVDPDDLRTGLYDSALPMEKRGNIAYNFVVAWNVVLKKYADMLAAREGRRKKGKNPEDPGKPEEPENPEQPQDPQRPEES